MTLILACINDQAATLVADRRLSSEQGPIDPEVTKLTAVFASDSIFAMAYTGFAMRGRGNPAAPMRPGEFITQEWLLKTLLDASREDPRGESMVRKLAAVATRDFAHLASSDTEGLTVVFVGYHYGEHPPRPYLWCVSNYEQVWPLASDGRHEKPEFVVSWMRDQRPSPDPWFVCAFGATDALTDTSYAALGPMLHDRWAPESIVSTNVDVIRQAHHIDDAIGASCTSLFFYRDGDTLVGAHHDEGTAAKYFPHVVDARAGGGHMMMHPEIWTEKPPWWST